MEPGHIDREDPSRSTTSSSTRSTCRNGARSYRPGRPRVGVAGVRAPAEAAMEPGHIDREDATSTGGLVTNFVAAMEPGHIDREDSAYPFSRFVCGLWPQWSPVISTGKTRSVVGRQERGGTGRNGARSYRPGRPAAPSANSHTKRSPQWSPVISTGKTTGPGVASARWCRRNGARSYRPGRPDADSARRAGTVRRNGARSYRPGRPSGNSPRSESYPVAAMEPGHIDREDPVIRHGRRDPGQ